MKIPFVTYKSLPNASKYFAILRVQLSLLVALSGVAQKSSTSDSSLYHLYSITGKISPKSVVHNGYGVFFAQNMMYRHNVTVYNRAYQQVYKIEDKVNASDFGFDYYTQPIKGGPVECAFSPDGKFAWVSNYSMSGGGEAYFNNVGCDNCSSASKYDSSFIYKINVATGSIDNIVQVGSVPKYVAVSPNNKYVLVSNWSSGDLSVVSVVQNKEIKRLKLGTFPRGIVIDSKSEYAYITLMGKREVVKLSLATFKSQKIKVGKGPRHLCISPNDAYLYITLNSENKIAKLNLETLETQKVKAGHQPRSMTIDAQGKYLYVVNYNDHNFTKFDANTLERLAITKTKSKPIGITYDDSLNNVWVSCYSGYIQIFKDSLVLSSKSGTTPKKQEKRGSIDSLTLSIENNNIEDESDAYYKNRSRYRKKVKTTEVELSKKDTYLIVTGAFSKPQSVEQRVKELQELGYTPQTYFDKEKKLTFVVAAQFSTKKQALASSIREDLEADGIKSTLKYEKGNAITATKEIAIADSTINAQKVAANNPVISKQKSAFSDTYLIVTGAFSKPQSVEHRVKELQELGYTPQTYFDKEKKLTFVVAAQFSTKKQALASSIREDLEADGIRSTMKYEKNNLNLMATNKINAPQKDAIEEEVKVKREHTSSEGYYYIGAGVFSKKSSVSNRTRALKKIGINPFYSVKNSLTFVYAGQFKTKELALQSEVVQLLEQNDINYSLIYNQNLKVVELK